MSKKKNNNLWLLLNAFVCVGLLLLIVGICLSMWTENALWVSGGVGIFANKDGFDYAAMGTICEILLLANLILVALYVIAFCLDYFKVGKLNYAKVMKLLSVVILVLTLVAIVLGVLYAVLTSYVQYKDLKTFYVKPAVGFYLMGAGSLANGLFGLCASSKK